MGYFVKPETTRLYLLSGQWIEVKRRLTNGERKRLESAGLSKRLTLGDGAKNNEVEIDFAEIGFAKVMSWVVDWSFEMDGARVPFSREALESLDPEIGQEIERVVDAHTEAQAGNSATTSANGSGPASSSASGTDGPGVTGPTPLPT